MLADQSPTVRWTLYGLGALCGLCVWSILASSIFLVITHMFKPDKFPFIEFWRYVRYYGFGNPVVGGHLKLSAAAATVVLGGTLFLIFGRGGNRRVRNIHGTSSWATRSELKKEGFYSRHGGIHVGVDSQGKYLTWKPDETSGPHIAVYAPTGSGKGVSIVIPNCLMFEGSVVVLDVKGEGYEITSGIHAHCGHEVHRFEPLSPTGQTACWNPLYYVRRDSLIDLFDDVQRIAINIYPIVTGDHAFWQDSARNAFAGTVAFLAESPEMPFTIGAVVRILSSRDGGKFMKARMEQRRQEGRPYTEATVMALDDYINGSDDLVNSVRKSITSKLGLWLNPRIDAATSRNDFDLRALRHKLQAIYIVIAPGDLTRTAPLLSLFFQQLIDLSAAVLPEHDPLCKYEVLVMLDEFPACGAMTNMANGFSLLRGYGLRLVMIMQSKAQLEELYGKAIMRSMLIDCGLEIVFNVKDNELAEEVSHRLGYNTVDTISTSGPQFWRALNSTKLSQTVSEGRRALLLPQEVTRLDKTKAVILKAGMNPILATRIRYWKDSFFKKLLRPAILVKKISVSVRMDTGSNDPSAVLLANFGAYTLEIALEDLTSARLGLQKAQEALKAWKADNRLKAWAYGWLGWMDSGVGLPSALVAWFVAKCRQITVRDAEVDHLCADIMRAQLDVKEAMAVQAKVRLNEENARRADVDRRVNPQDKPDTGAQTPVNQAATPSVGTAGQAPVGAAAAAAASGGTVPTKYEKPKPVLDSETRDDPSEAVAADSGNDAGGGTAAGPPVGQDAFDSQTGEILMPKSRSVPPAPLHPQFFQANALINAIAQTDVVFQNVGGSEAERTLNEILSGVSTMENPVGRSFERKHHA
jgi:type IV secretion system protein VirD4